ncbi:hypothetical protein C5Y96_13525 [Blastopirellula marina]|uniref:PilZ domain-containing protein n=2 Tax=Pirellulales TaxID=2691354 RepID=A0A2S8FGS4_9BACT|nr:hypothetical protein C5Y96_13525 [Blastopirellula marina]RCS51749.1 hypothetical protein DTL36_13535 [Bremerella cremea]
MNSDRRNSMRFSVAPSRVKAQLRVGKDTYKAELLDESMAGFAVAVEIPRRKLGEQGFVCESDCPLFGEIARLTVSGHSEYEVQIISIVPREDDSASATKSRVSLRLGTRVVREIYGEDRNSVGRNLRLVAAMGLAILFSLYCTAQSFSGHLASMVPTTELAWGDMLEQWKILGSGERSWRKEIAHATSHGYVVPNTPEMTELIEFSKALPTLHRVEKVMLFQQDSQFLQQLNLTAEQTLAVRKIAMEAAAAMEQLWMQLKHEHQAFEQQLGILLVELETRILANLSSTQAKMWMHAQFG